MKIVDIFEPNLYSFHYKDEEANEYYRLMELWTDVEYLKNFAKENKIEDVNQFIRKILRDAENIQDFLFEVENNKNILEHYFRPLNNNEFGFISLSKQKGKLVEDKLRLYAIKIDNNCFVITGGAIKMSQKMQDHADTKKELPKINKAQDILRENGIIDDESFYEFLIEA